MKKTIFVLILALVFAFSLAAQEKTDLEKEKAAVKAAVLNYIEGWYEGNVDRMNKALHPELLKRTPRAFPPTGGQIVSSLSKTNMLEYTKAGFGKKFPKDKLKLSVTVLDVYKHVATAKSVSPEFIDFLHLVKVNGEWKILNVLWESTKPPPPPKK
jgi:hypothetical protein